MTKMKREEKAMENSMVKEIAKYLNMKESTVKAYLRPGNRSDAAMSVKAFAAEMQKNQK